MTLHGSVSTLVAKNYDVFWFEAGDFDLLIAVPLHRGVTVEVGGSESKESRFSAI